MAKAFTKVSLTAANRSLDVILGKKDSVSGVVIMDTEGSGREISLEVWDRDVLQLQSKVIPPTAEGFDETALVYKKRCFTGSIEYGTVIYDNQSGATGTRVLSVYSKVAAVGTLYIEVNRVDT
jgi:hypothetical protein